MSNMQGARRGHNHLSRRTVEKLLLIPAVGVAAVALFVEGNNFLDRRSGLDAAVGAGAAAGKGNKTRDPNVRYVSFRFGPGHNSLSFAAAKYASGEDYLEASSRIMEYIPGVTESERQHYTVYPGEVVTFAVNTKTDEVVPKEQAPPLPGSAEKQ